MKPKVKRSIVKTVLVILFLIFIINLFIPHITYSHKELEYKIIYVNKGDTLWSIAKAEQESNPYYAGKDLRDIIYNIKK